MLEGKAAKEDRPHCKSHTKEIGFDPGDTKGFKEAVVEENEPDCHVKERSEGGKLEKGDLLSSYTNPGKG